jgi:hypothetical protein
MEIQELVARHRDLVVMVLSLRRAGGAVPFDVANDSDDALREAVRVGLLAGDLTEVGSRTTGVLFTTPLLAEAETFHRETAGCVAGLTKNLTDKHANSSLPKGARRL